MKISIFVFLFSVISFYFQPVMAKSPPLNIATGWGAMNGPVVIAHEKGFFKEQGVEVTTTFTRMDKLSIQAYLQGKVDATTTNSIHIVRSNCDVSDHVIIGTLSYSDNQLKLLARKSAGITRISDLKGKKNAVPRATFAHFYLEMIDYSLLAEIDPKRVTIIR